MPASGPGPTGALPDRTIPIDLWHGTSAEGAAGVRGGVRVDVNSAHPGRRQWGEGFYLGDSAAIGEEYASQTASPTVLRFRPVVLSELGEVLDLTTGVDASTWDAWLDGPIADGLPMTRRTIWDSNPEGRGQLFNAFLAQIGRQPDVVIAPHPPGRQVIVRTQRAADILNANLP